jgi:hypothetical protein
MSDAGRSLRVFISYARSDASAFAEDLLQGLEVAGFEPFLDRHDIAAGEDWEARLGALIQAADTVVFVVSPAAAKSERCAWEVARAEELSKRIIPVVAIDVPEADTPKGLSRRNYIFFGADRSFVRALAELAAALKTDIDWIREHTRLGELAARWSERNRAEALLLRGSELDAAKAWLAGWQAPAPAPTETHRAFIGESEAAEHERLGAERLRLEEITRAQVERERALKRLRRGTLVAGAVVGALFLATAAGGVALHQVNGQLDRAKASLYRRDQALSSAQVRLQGLVRQLAEAQAQVAAQSLRLRGLVLSGAPAEQVIEAQADLAATQDELQSIDEQAAAVGQTVAWDSPFGPVQFDFAQPLAVEEHEQTEEFKFNTRTRF